MRTVEPWVERPLTTFLEESSARIAAVLTPSGQVVAQHGFAAAPDLMAAASLAAGIMAATSELSRVIGAPPLRELAYEGHDVGIYLAAIELPGRRWLGLVAYGKDSSLGLVQLFFGELVKDLGRAAPPKPFALAGPAALDPDFEAELDRNLRALFGR
ncbi:MAG TPA: roadblock/LC7 domain-containing protein [Gemmatimonadales bacterium]|nr:roadblock/LC7 domain-containing protein [Gemmatimonadales bacterium]